MEVRSSAEIAGLAVSPFLPRTALTSLAKPVARDIARAIDRINWDQDSGNYLELQPPFRLRKIAPFPRCRTLGGRLPLGMLGVMTASQALQAAAFTEVGARPRLVWQQHQEPRQGMPSEEWHGHKNT
jgi:hypothetical protein